MKIVVFKGGVGNQLFQYCLIEYLSNKGYTVYYKDETFGHNGLEIDKYFEVELKKLPRFADFIYTRIKHKHPKIFTKITANNVFIKSKIRFDGYWQDKKYMSFANLIRFKSLILNSKNKEIEKQIENTNSVSIHVRRGDYLKFPEQYGGICTVEYYNKAIAIIKEKISNPVFYIFSDDIEWCKSNIDIPNAEYVGWNKGNDSIIDMYLMSKCKANIIANSTFSYWGALISKNNTVIYPKRWFANKQSPNLFNNDWIGL